MKHLPSLFGLLFGLFLNVSPLLGQELEVTMKNVRSDKGVLMVGLFNSEKTFTKTIWKGAKPNAKVGDVKVIFRDIPAGDYAISVFHDENGDGKLDTNLIGMPKEGFGFSNDAMGTFGPPAFEKRKLLSRQIGQSH